MSSADAKLGYDQWISVKITNNHKTKVIKIKNARVKYGKFHKNGNQDAEISPSQINNKEIKPNSNSFTISACGRSWSPTGTEGSFDLVEASTGIRICNFYWDCPYPYSPKIINFTELTNVNPDWGVKTENFSFGPFLPLGNGEVTCDEARSQVSA